MSGNALPIVGNLCVYLIVFTNTFQIQMHAPFVIFNSNTNKKNYVFKYNYKYLGTYLNPTLVTSESHK